MKFTTQLLTILAASSVYAIPTKRQVNDINIDIGENDFGSIGNKIPDDISIPVDLSDPNNLDVSSFNMGINEQCEKTLDQYKECLEGNSEIDVNNKENVCNIVNSEKCQNFFSDDIKNNQGCENLNEIAARVLNFYKKGNTISLKMQCAKDENGKFCPLSNISPKLMSIEKEGGDSDKEFETLYTEAVSETCKSRSCINAALEFESGYNEIKQETAEFKDQVETMYNFIGAFKDMPLQNPSAKYRRAFSMENIDINSDKDAADKLIKATSDYLKSEECSVQAPKAESSATTLKFTAALIVTLALFLF